MRRDFLTVTLHPAVDRVYALERVVPGEALVAELRLVRAAGKGVNAARILRRLLDFFGANEAAPRRVRALVWPGKEEAALFRRELRAAGVTPLLLARSTPTRFGLTFAETAAARTTHIRETMQPPSVAEEVALSAFFDKSPCAGWTAFCGSAPPRMRPRTLRRLCSLPKRRGGRVLCDAGGLLLEAAAAAGVNVLKGNAAELGEWLRVAAGRGLFGKEARRLAGTACRGDVFDRRRQADLSLLRAAVPARGGPEEIILTLGADGALLARREEIWFARAPRLPRGKRGGTVGCGDAATAGRLWAADDDCDPEETLRRVVACGSAKPASLDPGDLDPRRVVALLKRTKAERLL